MVTVANVVVGELVNNLIDKLKVNFSLIKGVEKDVEKLSSMLSTIKAVLGEAESTQFKDTLITDWLTKIKDAAYDVEDVLDDWLWELEEVTNRKASHSISTRFDFTRIEFRRKIAKRLKSVMARFDEIDKEKSNFHFKTSDASSQMESEFTKDRESSSQLSEPKIYGRDKDVINIVNMLLQTDHSSQDILIFPIVGFGGVGKTTLAQLVYKHKRIVGCFEKMIWVCVSDPFDVKKVLKEILDSFGGCNSGSLDFLQNKVLESLKDKKYLLVLDDVWSEKEDEWNKLRSSLTSGGKGSSIMVTTRLTGVASIVRNASPPYNLGVLPDEDCWSLLKSRALGDKGEEQHPNLVPIGKEIAKKCKGIPLAAKSLGSLLKLKTKESYWKHVRDHPIWKLDNDEGNSILAALRLSYNHLPSHLKQCFSYCSIYPKDSEMGKTKLIYLWMANGFIQSQGMLELEEVGDDMFHELLRRSFFQDTQEDEDGNIEFFKIHDLMHDLACSVMKNESSIKEVGGVKDVPKTIRHLAVIGDSKRSSTDIDLVIASKSSFRTLFFFEPINFHSFTFATTLRVLNLRDMHLSTLPPSICQLKHLKFLDLSRNNLASLPESVCRLRYMQMLDLSHNDITTLPRSIGSLENLRYLSLSDCSCLTSIPESIGNVVSLRYLDLSYCCCLTLIPESIGNVVSLRYLDLSCCCCLTSIPKLIASPVTGIQESNSTLLKLKIFECDILKSMSEGMQYLTSLERLIIHHCKELEFEANDFQHLISLRELTLQSLPKLRVLPVMGIQGSNSTLLRLEIESCDSLKSVSEGLQCRTSLETLIIESCAELEFEANDFQQLISLRELDLYGLHKLIALPVMGIQGSNSTLLKLEIWDCNSLKSVSEGLQYLTSLQTLEISRCGEVEFEENEFQHLISLRQLSLRELPKLIALPVMGIQGSNSTLLKLEISRCGSLKSVSEGMQYLTSLEELFIESCKELEFEANDFQHLISLRQLTLYELPKLIALPVMGIQGSNSTLLNLTIAGCDSLKSVSEGLQYLTSLQTLFIGYCKELEFEANDFQHLIALRKLTLYGLPKFEANDFQHLISLRNMTLRWLAKLIALPVMGIQGSNNTLRVLKIEWCESLKSVSEGLQYLTSLEVLEIRNCKELEFEANEFQHLISLRQLTLRILPKLRALPEVPTMLQQLKIEDCENLRRLPQGIQHITTLRYLTIRRCHEELHTRCERENGQDWNLIAHIPKIRNERANWNHNDSDTSD